MICEFQRRGILQPTSCAAAAPSTSRFEDVDTVDHGVKVTVLSIARNFCSVFIWTNNNNNDSVTMVGVEVRSRLFKRWQGKVSVCKFRSKRTSFVVSILECLLRCASALDERVDLRARVRGIMVAGGKHCHDQPRHVLPGCAHLLRPTACTSGEALSLSWSCTRSLACSRNCHAG